MAEREVTCDILHRVQLSFARATISDAVFHTFYNRLIGKSEIIRERFLHTDMARQHQLLKASLIHLIGYAAGNEHSRAAIQALGVSHGREGLDISPDLYEYWIDALVESFRKHDPDWTVELEQDWRTIVAPGINSMVAEYDPPQL